MYESGTLKWLSLKIHVQNFYGYCEENNRGYMIRYGEVLSTLCYGNMRSKSLPVTSPPGLKCGFPCTGYNLVFWYQKMSVNSQLYQTTRREPAGKPYCNPGGDITRSDLIDLMSLQEYLSLHTVVNLKVPNFNKEYGRNKRQKYLVSLILVIFHAFSPVQFIDEGNTRYIVTLHLTIYS